MRGGERAAGRGRGDVDRSVGFFRERDDGFEDARVEDGSCVYLGPDDKGEVVCPIHDGDEILRDFRREASR